MKTSMFWKIPCPRNLLIVTVLAAVVPILPLPSYVFHILIMLLFFSYLSTAWTIVSGYGKQISLGHSSFVGLGAYVPTLLLVYFGITPWFGAAAGIAVSLTVALLIGFPAFKFGLRGPHFSFATMALPAILESIFISARNVTGGSLGISIPYKESWVYFQFASKIPYYYIALLMWFLAANLAFSIERNWFGYYLMAIREDEDAAGAVGINVTRCKLIALLLSVALTAWGGVFYAQYNLYIDPATLFGLPLSFQIATTSTIGNPKRWIGPTIGALVLVPFSEILRILTGATFGSLSFLFYGALLMIVARFLPDGLLGLMTKKAK